MATDPAKPKLVKTLEDVTQKTGLTGPHSPYALPGRMLISFLGNKDGGLPAGLAEFNNDGTFIRRIDLPRDAPYGYDVAIKPDLNRMVTSSFTPPNNYKKPFAKMDLKKFGNQLVVWDFRERKPLQTLTAGGAPLECRWSLKEGANYGFTNCALDDSIWLWEGDKDGKYTTPQAVRHRQAARRPAAVAGRYVPLRQLLRLRRDAAVGRQRPEEAGPEASLKLGEHPNMMHVTGDGKRMYITNSLLSTMDPSEQFWVKMARIGKDGLEAEPKLMIDLTKLPGGAVRGHDMLLK